MPQGHNESSYRFQVIELETNKNHYFFEFKQLKERFDISKTLFYYLAKDDGYYSKKWEKYKFLKVYKPLNTTIPITYQ